MANKMTQRDYFNETKSVLETLGRDDLVAFINERIAALDKKSANRKPTKTQAENEGIKAVILEVLEKSENPLTVTEVLKADERLSGFTAQKISALMTQLVGGGEVEKTVEKRVSRFSVTAE